jgi:hypothetical protein
MSYGVGPSPYWTAGVVCYSARRLPTAKLLVFDTGGHVLLGQDAHVRDAVAQFLGEPTPPAKQHPEPTGAVPSGL